MSDIHQTVMLCSFDSVDIASPFCHVNFRREAQMLASGSAPDMAIAVATGAADMGLDVLPPAAASEPSGATTTPEVDVVGGLTASLVAAIESFDEQFLSLSFRLTTVLQSTSKATGDGLTQTELAI
eukprot:scaffold353203_cov46-Prasinocladus_malaysianus.AAC.1